MPRKRLATPSILSGHAAVRLLIVSYFAALALHVIPGTDLSALLDPFLPPLAAEIATSALVLTFSTLILIGWHRRAAALLLALMTFWASYLGMLSAPVAELGSFWRDLALVGALTMTYADRTGAEAARSHSPGSRRHRPAISRPRPQPQGGAPRIDPDLFRQDLARAR